MRIDKYLKTSRLIKRRAIAKEACEKGRIMINGRPAKAGSNIDEGDIINIKFGKSEIVVKVLSTNENIKKEDASSAYEIVNES